jgi:hypothetical protein
MHFFIKKGLQSFFECGIIITEREVIKMKKMLVFDMDGTIANLYGVEGWLDDLIAKNERPYAVAEPMYDMDTLAFVLDALKSLGWKIAVTSWLAKNSNNAYDEKVKKAKIEWLAKYGFPYDVLNIVPYGTDKSSVTAIYGGYQVLIDDEENNLKAWKNGLTIDAKSDILSILLKILDEEY